MGVVSLQEVPPDGCPHPNEFDRHRIERSLASRKRYRYVTPRVLPMTGGYKIESPCCSRNIDPEGGTIDVAMLQFDMDTVRWNLYRKEHAAGTWHLDAYFPRLPELLDYLNTDSERKFWQ